MVEVRRELVVGPRVVGHGVLYPHIVKLPGVRRARPLQEPDRLLPSGVRQELIAGYGRALRQSHVVQRDAGVRQPAREPTSL